MDLSRYIRLLKKRWWQIILIGLVGGAAATYFTYRQQPVYSSTAMVLLSPASSQNSFISLSPVVASQTLAKSYSHYLRTAAFAELVIARSGLNMSASELINSVQTQIIEGTQFFQITAYANSPEQAQLLADVIAQNFVQENLEQQRRDVAAKRAAGDVDNVKALLIEKLERERQYYEVQVESLRGEVARIEQQPPSAARDERLSATQQRLSEYETRLVGIMSDQIELQPPIDEQQINSVTIVEPASLPRNPINAPGPRNIVYALAASLVLGAALAFGLEYLDYTVRSPEELEDVIGQSIMGAVGVIQPAAGQGPQGRAQSEGPNNDLVVLADPRSPLAEAFRSLRTNLRFSGLGTKTRGVVITSAAPGEGKSVVAANLAVVFAQAGRRVILVDADLRRPSMHRRFRLPNNVGLSDLLIDENATSPEVIHSYLQPGPVENLQIMTSGPVPPNPAELLSADWVLSIFDALEAQADVVIWDTPPALTVTDALILAARSGATLQVVRAGSTRRDLIKRTREVLQRVEAHVLAPILNQVQAADIGYYQYYYYRGYKYGEPAPGERSRSSPRSSPMRAAPEPQRNVAPNGHDAPPQPAQPVADGRNGAPGRPAQRPPERSAAQRLFGRG